MDSISQAVLGAAVAAACVPARQRRKALLLGAALGTLPDLDVFVDYGDGVSNMTFHRGFSHSLFVLLPLALLLWAALRRWWAPVREVPRAWLAAIALPLLTHPLLDALTVYGTQLFWPLAMPPVMGGSLFIIDPLYTLPLLVAVLAAALAGEARRGATALVAGLVLSTGYAGWSLMAQQHVDAVAAESLRGTPHAEAPRLVVAMPFTTLAWRVVVLTPEGYLEGERSLVADDGPIEFIEHRFDRRLLDEAGGLWAVQRLLWFSHGFQRADVVDGELRLGDLRMGQHPTFFFTHAVARREGGAWGPADNRQIEQPRVREGQLAGLWRRVWFGEPIPGTPFAERAAARAQAAEAKSGATPAINASK
ncbi:metal-dependent hydrolase [Silanimonas algicola]